jgi:hypothetical protein
MKIANAFCVHVLSNEKLVEPLRLFLQLKKQTKTGRLLKPKFERTQKKHFNTMLAERWLNVKNEIIFLRKLSTIQRYYAIKGKMASCITDKVLTDRSIFLAFIAAIVFKAINKKNKWKKKRGTPAAVSGRGKSTRPLLPKIAYSNAISVRYFASHLGVSIGKAAKLKRLALQYKFIKVKSKEREFEFYLDGRLISPTNEQLPAVHSDFPQFFGRVFKKRGQLFYRQPDQIFTTI